MSELTKTARELGCRDPLMIEMADRIDELEIGLKLMIGSACLHQINDIAAALMSGAPRKMLTEVKETHADSTEVFAK